jgi:glycerol-3-phosphate acyltransferase PlsY
MSPSAIWPLLIACAYLLGSIPFGLFVGKANGIDPRTAGSGNIGATNVGRLLGKKFFFIVFFLDLLKSFVPMVLASLLLRHLAQRSWSDFTLALSVGGAAVLGHMFSVFLKFKGGKGVSTSAGLVLGLMPYYTLSGVLAIGVFVVVFKLTRYVSLGSMIAAASFPLIYMGIGLWMGWPVFGAQLPLLIFGGIIALMILYRHKTNIARLMAGTESRFTSRNPDSPLAASQTSDTP